MGVEEGEIAVIGMDKFSLKTTVDGMLELKVIFWGFLLTSSVIEVVAEL